MWYGSNVHKEETVRKYEACCLFPPEQELFERGKEAVKTRLQESGANITKEDDMGQRALAYPVKNLNQGHYFLFEMEMDPEKVIDTEKSFKLIGDLLKFLIVRQES